MSLYLGAPQNWEELEQAFASLQTYLGKQSEALAKWVSVPYSAGMFRATAGTWTVQQGDVKVFEYAVIGELLYLRIVLFHTSTDANVTNDLRISLPSGFRCRDVHYTGLVQWDDDAGAGQEGIGKVFMADTTNTQILRLVRDVLPTSTNWPASLTNTFSLRMNLVIPVVTDPAL